MKNELSKITGHPIQSWDDLPESFYLELRPEQFKKIRERCNSSGYNFPSSVFDRCIDSLYMNFMLRSDEYSKKTITQFLSNWHQFTSWAYENNIKILPASPKDVELYIESKKSVLHRNTIKSHFWAINKVHEICGLKNPCSDRYVKSKLNGIVRKKIIAREGTGQASPFQNTDLIAITELWRDTGCLLDNRNLCILTVAYETLLRESELVRIKGKDIKVQSDGSASLTIPFTKTNKSGNVEHAWLSPETVELLTIQAAAVKCSFYSNDSVDPSSEQYLFMPYRRSRMPDNSSVLSNKHIRSNYIDKVFRSAFDLLGKSGKPWSGHSARVGAAIDMDANNTEILTIQHMGRWKTSEMPYRYTHEQRSVNNNPMKKIRAGN